MQTPTLVTIMEGAQLIGLIITEGEALALKIKSHFELDPNITASITTLTGNAVTSDDATMDEINAWRTSVGLAPLQKSS